ncbi:cytochrome b/b6 domain-containing protein [Pseudosulfitobacter sp. SM2401]|uniref:cytochrome b/b6 domain-containing protein n=1 Tax=Pseudosulfitobacter sp. SM2401 TaxID=3350098 RepID=UPI0036F23194
MSLANTSHSYGSIAKTFHWLTALLILTLIPLGIIANGMEYETSEQLARKAWLFSLHKTLGVTVFFVALARIGWAIKQAKPGGLHPERKMESWLAETIHWLLYGSLVLVPLSGWVHHSATTGFAPIWWPFGQSLPFVPKSESLAALTAGLHIVFERVLAASILLHIAGALKHHFVDKDVTLRRMWFGKPALPDTKPAHHSALPLASALVAWAAALMIGSAIGVFSHHETSAQAAELGDVQSDWTVQDGTIDITITQFGNEVTGQFEDWTAAITFDPETGTGTAEVNISIGSLTLGSVTAQAMGPDYFDSTTFPTAVFTADIAPIVDGHMATGTLTVRDKTVPIEMPFSLNVQDDTAQMSATLTLDRRDFDVGNNMADDSSLKFPVNVQINLTAQR